MYVKTKELGPWGEGDTPAAPPFDPPLKSLDVFVRDIFKWNELFTQNVHELFLIFYPNYMSKLSNFCEILIFTEFPCDFAEILVMIEGTEEFKIWLNFTSYSNSKLLNQIS